MRGSKTVLGYNKTELEITNPQQYDGVLVTAAESIAHHVIGQGVVPTGLGRWDGFEYKGKEELKCA